MNAERNYPKTLVEAVRYFSDPQVTHEFFVSIRWPDGVVRCPHCGGTDVRFLAHYYRWECKAKHPRRQFTVKVGTIMEDSPLGLDKWAVAFWLEANAKNSISSYEVHRALGITQKSAWFMQHRIRLALQSGDITKIGGGAGGSPVEADETFVGGLAKNMHASRRRKTITGTGGAGKAIVMGLLERHTGKRCSQMRTTVIPNTQQPTLHEIIHKNVEPGSSLYTDAHGGYLGLTPEFVHAFIDHAERYVDGQVHTNGAENFWALFKRCIKGTHVSVDPAHLFRYLDAECFRFNNRENEDGERLLLALQGIAGKRLTYKALIGAVETHPASGKGEANASMPS